MKQFPPYTPGQRHRLTTINPQSKYRINNSTPRSIKRLQYHIQQSAGRNHSGKITVQGQGGGNFHQYRIVDFHRSLFNIPAIVRDIVYDPSRTANLMLLSYNNGLISYQIAIEGIKIGQIIESGVNVPITIGNSLPLISIPTGVPISLIETVPGHGASLCRSAGTFATIVKKDLQNGLVTISLKSGIFKSIPLQGIATIGQVANIDHKNQILGKAGVSRWYNIRPTVRGVAKNPIDHPHGGGQGKTSGGRISVTPFGRLTKGKKTRAKNKANSISHQTKII